MMAISAESAARAQTLIDSGACAESYACYTCGSCDFECPVNIATGRLQPQRVVRLANLGFLDDLLNLPQIWYCLGCRRCEQVCPNTVKPATLIEYLRMEINRRGLVSMEIIRKFQDLFTRFQQVRWHAIHLCQNEKVENISDKMWREWQKIPVSDFTMPISPDKLRYDTKQWWDAIDISKTTACFTCGECSSACPVSGRREIFDPRFIFRMVNLGLLEELIRSPSIWLCISCGRCTEACSQLVDGRRLILWLQKLSVEEGVVDINFSLRLEKMNRAVFTYFLDEIDTLFHFNRHLARVH